MSNPQPAPPKQEQFLATLAHELRNPLAPMRHCVSILARTVEDATAQEAVQVMDRQLRQLSRLVDDLLEVSRLTRGTLELHKAPLDVGELLDFAVEGSLPTIEAGGHRLSVRRPEPPLRIDGDRARLAQAVGNLLDNAARYSQPGSEILLEARREGDETVIRVSDTGTGISPEALPQVFELFSQVDERALQPSNGLGIGLSLVRAVMELHGGTATAASEGRGRGSRFELRLPVLAASQRDAHALAVQRTSEANTRRILVVDDNHDAADTLATLLRLDGAVVDVAYDGPAALAAIDAFRPRAVVLDLGMPGMSGYDVARAVRDRQDLDNLKLIALTGWGQDADRRMTAEAGFDHHLTKPADIDTVQAVLSNLA
jgi:CheY-like chemotaxis protein